MGVSNDDIRNALKKKRIYLYEVAKRLGVSEVTFIRWLRWPLDEEKRKRIWIAIDSISKEHADG